MQQLRLRRDVIRWSTVIIWVTVYILDTVSISLSICWKSLRRLNTAMTRHLRCRRQSVWLLCSFLLFPFSFICNRRFSFPFVVSSFADSFGYAFFLGATSFFQGHCVLERRWCHHRWRFGLPCPWTSTLKLRRRRQSVYQYTYWTYTRQKQTRLPCWVVASLPRLSKC